MIRASARLAAAAAVLAGAACATIQAPPGGPEDKQAPQLVAARPDTNAILTSWRGPVVFAFDESLSEAGVDSSVSLSPVRGGVDVDQDGGEIRVQPKRGWQPGQIYQVEVAPGIRDRFGNIRKEGIRLVFSTGPAIPNTEASGVVTERTTGNPARVRVDAVRTTDSLTYTTQTDSAGAFRFRQVPEGEYRVTAYRDANRNNRTDVFEARDTARFTLAAGAAPTARLAILLPDSTPPRSGSAAVSAEGGPAGWVEVRFDDYLDAAQTVTPAQVSIVGPDSLPVAIAEV
ncbi:MAG TPA: Ig-like domain-containing protein, partial [Longimicrobium sp.]|uniref:Ig-like domain-containing protein n=1 Tax=Longimicrobium sp. TaxID=2029185 RepID=UPI002ED7C7B8